MSAARVGATLTLRVVATLLLVTLALAGVALMLVLGRRMQLIALLGLLTSLGLYHLWRRRDADPRALPRGRRRRFANARLVSRHLR